MIFFFRFFPMVPPMIFFYPLVPQGKQEKLAKVSLWPKFHSGQSVTSQIDTGQSVSPAKLSLAKLSLAKRSFCPKCHSGQSVLAKVSWPKCHSGQIVIQPVRYIQGNTHCLYDQAIFADAFQAC